MFENFSQEALKVIMYAQEEARKNQTSLAEPEHLLLGLLKDPETLAYQILKTKNIDFEVIKTQLKNPHPERKMRVLDIHFSETSHKAFDLAETETRHFQHGPIDSDHLLLGLIELGDQRCLKALVMAGAHIQHLRWNILRQRYQRRNAEIRTINLQQYGRDLTLQLENRLIPLVLEWKPMVERVIQYLGMGQKHNTLLVGEAGVGKTALVHALNQFILSSRIFKRFSHCRLVQLDIEKMLAEAGTDERLYEMTTSMLGEIRQSGDIILVIENIHQLFLANKKEMEFIIAQPLLALLEEPNTYCIATTTPNNYSFLKERTQIQHLFQTLEVPSAPPELSLDILQHWKTKVENHHHISIQADTLKQAVSVAGRIKTEQKMPEAALTLLELSASKKVWEWTSAVQEYRETERELRQLIEQRGIMAPDIEESDTLRTAFEHIKSQIVRAEDRLYHLKHFVDTETLELVPQDILTDLHPLSNGA